MPFDPKALAPILGAVGGLRGGSNAFMQRWQELEQAKQQRAMQEQQLARQTMLDEQGAAREQRIGDQQQQQLMLQAEAARRADEAQRMQYTQQLQGLFTNENVDPDVALQLATLNPPSGYDVGAIQSLANKVFTPDERTRRKALKRLNELEKDPQIKRLIESGEDGAATFEITELGGNPEDPQGRPLYTRAQLMRLAQKAVPTGPLPKAAQTDDMSKSSLQVQAAAALRRGDMEDYNRILRVQKEVNQADDRPTQGSDPEIAALRKDLLRMQVERAGEPKEPNQAQFTAAAYAGRMEQAESTLESTAETIQNMGVAPFELQTNSWFARPSFQSKDVQAYMQASRNFINAVLRRESGAVISKEEFAEARQQYLPVAGDSPEVLVQKAANRQYVFDTMKRASGGAYAAPPTAPSPLTKDAKVGGVYLHNGKKVRVREKTRTGFLFDEVVE
jgi:hypothetical protein